MGLFISIPDLEHTSKNPLLNNVTLIVGHNEKIFKNIMNFKTKLLIGDSSEKYADHIENVYVYDEFSSNIIEKIIASKKRNVALLIDNFDDPQIIDNLKAYRKEMKKINLQVFLFCEMIPKCDLASFDVVILGSTENSYDLYNSIGFYFVASETIFTETCDHYINEDQVIVIKPNDILGEYMYTYPL